MKITILGSGCPTCELLYNKIKKLKEEGKIDAEVEYVSDVDELIKRGFMGSPVLLINDEPVFIGMPHSDEKILELIKDYSS